MQNKRCTKCGKLKNLKDFSIDKSTKDGFNFWCKICRNKDRKNYYKKFPWRRTLSTIRYRCYNKNNSRYKDYGERGIKNYLTEEELKYLWFRDKAYLLKQPSIDRIDNDGNYTYENCRFIEKLENTIKDHKKKISQYQLDETFIRNWGSATEVKIELNIDNSDIGKCIKGKIKSAGRFIWKLGEYK